MEKQKNYYEKYLKYKLKYNNLQYMGGSTPTEIPNMYCHYIVNEPEFKNSEYDNKYVIFNKGQFSNSGIYTENNADDDDAYKQMLLRFSNTPTFNNILDRLILNNIFKLILEECYNKYNLNLTTAQNVSEPIIKKGNVQIPKSIIDSITELQRMSFSYAYTLYSYDTNKGIYFINYKIFNKKEPLEYYSSYKSNKCILILTSTKELNPELVSILTEVLRKEIEDTTISEDLIETKLYAPLQKVLQTTFVSLQTKLKNILGNKDRLYNKIILTLKNEENTIYTNIVTSINHILRPTNKQNSDEQNTEFTPTKIPPKFVIESKLENELVTLLQQTLARLYSSIPIILDNLELHIKESLQTKIKLLLTSEVQQIKTDMLNIIRQKYNNKYRLLTHTA